jgi:hypothetical protein
MIRPKKKATLKMQEGLNPMVAGDIITTIEIKFAPSKNLPKGSKIQIKIPQIYSPKPLTYELLEKNKINHQRTLTVRAARTTPPLTSTTA